MERSPAQFVTVNGKRLRCGWTTGTCAAAATYAAAELLLAGHCPAAVSVTTPAGAVARMDVAESGVDADEAYAAVIKDAGDDPDVTDGCLVIAHVRRLDAVGITIDGGTGVGRVTKAGLDQPVGAAAINRVPREMIERAAREALEAASASCGLSITISIPAGEKLAAKTFNPRLGIEGGISVLGTSGIVKPMSEEALVSSIELEMRVLYEGGCRHLLVTPGNYGRDFASDVLGLSLTGSVQCSNYIGAVLDQARVIGFASVLVVGHIGKMVKVAAGIMNTHSRMADARLETLAAHAALQGACHEAIVEVMNAATTDAALDALERHGCLSSTMGSLCGALERVLTRKAEGAYSVGAVVFSQERGVLAMTSAAGALLEYHKDDSTAKEAR